MTNLDESQYKVYKILEEKADFLNQCDLFSDKTYHAVAIGFKNVRKRILLLVFGAWFY